MTVFFILLLYLHFSHQVVFVSDLVLDLLEVLGGLSKILFLQLVLVLACRQLWRGEDVLDGVGNDEVFVGHETMNRLLILLGHWGLLEAICVGFLRN